MDFVRNIIDAFIYISQNWDLLLDLTIDHMMMVGLGLILALIVGIPLGLLCAIKERLAPTILSLANIIQNIPSIALLAILMLYFGLGFYTVVAGLFLYSLLPIVRNTYVGVKEVDPSITEAGLGIGMTGLQLLRKIQIPLALPFITAGFRVAAVVAIGVASIAPFVGGDGLGREIVSGINARDDVRIYAGAIPAAGLAIISDLLLGRLEKKSKKRIG